jgi:hypothetical protein
LEEMEYARGGRGKRWRNTPADQLEGVRQRLNEPWVEK